MSYYDSTVANYDNQISANNNTITTCTNNIKSCEDDIAELKQLKIHVGNVDSAVVAAATASENKLINLPALVTNPFSILKPTFFSNFIDAIKGPEHTKARKATENAIGKIDTKIKELQKTIDNLQEQIKTANGNIKILQDQRKIYIFEQTEKQEEAKNNEAAAKA